VKEYRHKYVFLIGEGLVQPFDVEAIHHHVNLNPIHSLTRRPLSAEEMNYIQFYYDCHMKYRDSNLNSEMRRAQYSEMRRWASREKIQVLNPGLYESVR
jgi:uncharacterized Rmd1/YagE family protein